MLEFLDLKSNSLDALPMPPRETQRLRELNLHKNLLTAIPPVFFRSFPALEILDLSCNAFSTFPADQFAHLTRLIRLSLADNAFPAPPVLPTSLQHLDLSYNKTLDRLPWPLPPQLTTLTCTNGILAALHQALFGPSLKLRRLDLSFNAIDRLPDSLATLPDLEYLSLHGNPIRELPWSFAHGPPRLATFVLPWKGFMLPPEPIAKRAAKDTGELRSWLAERMPRERRREEPPRPSHRAPSLDTARAELPPSPTREAREERKPVGASASIAAQIARSRPGSPQKPSPLQIEVGDLRGIRNYAPRSAPVSPDKASPDRRKSTRTGIADM